MRSTIRSALERHGLRAVGIEPLEGGSAGPIARLRFEDGATAIAKLSLDPAERERLPSEAESLDAMRMPGGPRIPAILDRGPELLLLEDLGSGAPGPEFWDELAEGLATLHSRRGPAFGFHRTTWLGRTAQDNGWLDDGWAFFGARRIRPLLARAFDAGLLDSEELRSGERLCGRLRERIPEAAPVLVHGDLWRGNVVCDRDGRPALVDPAAHYGWAEADAAATTLFGGFPPRFLRSYQSVAGLDPRWTERIPYYNLVHLLNHLVLFGGAWSAQVRAILARG